MRRVSGKCRNKSKKITCSELTLNLNRRFFPTPCMYACPVIPKQEKDQVIRTWGYSDWRWSFWPSLPLLQHFVHFLSTFQKEFYFRMFSPFLSGIILKVSFGSSVHITRMFFLVSRSAERWYSPSGVSPTYDVTTRCNRTCFFVCICTIFRNTSALDAIFNT